MAIGVEWRGESYGLLIDCIGEVLKLDDEAREPNPVNLTTGWRACRRHPSAGRALLIVLDVERVLDIAVAPIAA